MEENKHQRNLLQICDEKDCALKEEISNMKFQLQERMKV